MVDPRPESDLGLESSQGPTLPDGMEIAGSDAGFRTDPQGPQDLDGAPVLEPVGAIAPWTSC